MHLASLPESVDPQAFWRDYYAPLMGLPREALRHAYLCSPVHRAALAAFPREGVVVDAGSGLGVLSVLNEDPARRVIGVDEVPSLLRLARVLSPRDRFLEGTLDRLPLEDASADLYVAISSIECTTLGLEASLAEAHRVLRPGGRLFAACLRLPLDARLREKGELASTLGRLRIERLLTLPASRPERAVAIYYSRRELRLALEASGFPNPRIEKSDLLGGLAYSRFLAPIRPAILARLERLVRTASDGARASPAARIALDLAREDGAGFSRTRLPFSALRRVFAYWNVLLAEKPRAAR